MEVSVSITDAAYYHAQAAKLRRLAGQASDDRTVEILLGAAGECEESAAELEAGRG